MNFKERKYLTIEEKRKLVLEGKDVPLCVYSDERAEKQRKRKQRELDKRFSKNI